MHKLIINKLGPIQHCELECTDFIMLTGAQASGKSTVAKAIYFFRTMKDDILNLAMKQAIDTMQGGERELLSLRRDLENGMREKFLRIFGSSWGMQNDMFIEYFYTDTVSAKICLKEEKEYPTPNYIWIELSNELKIFLGIHNKCLKAESTGISDTAKEKLKKDLAVAFDDYYSVVYIPAGRSMITLLSNQLSYIYTTMEDSQKRALDYCTQDYLERILRLKPEFDYGVNGLIRTDKTSRISSKTMNKALELINHILCGTYQCNNGEERIMLETGKYVKINFASSGQQESVWILNLLFYYFMQNKPTLFIIEEPESHLFPEAQKYITELIALIFNQGNSMLVTTHSPYVLGALNNLLYAQNASARNKLQVETVIPSMLWLQQINFSAWFVKNGGIENCVDSEMGMIQNEKIDEISKAINQEFDKIFDIDSENS